MWCNSRIIHIGSSDNSANRIEHFSFCSKKRITGVPENEVQNHWKDFKEFVCGERAGERKQEFLIFNNISVLIGVPIKLCEYNMGI